MGKTTTPVLETLGTGLSLPDAQTLLAAAKEISEAVRALDETMVGRIAAVESRIEALEARFGVWNGPPFCGDAGCSCEIVDPAIQEHVDRISHSHVFAAGLNAYNFAELTARVQDIEGALHAVAEAVH